MKGRSSRRLSSTGLCLAAALMAWSSCTARVPILYTGTIVSGEITASGTVALQCDDGSTATVQDSIRAALPHIPGL
jgi:hypothetical protein